MSYWMTQSLLSNWQHFLDADDLWADKSWASFLSALRREEQPLTEAMKRGYSLRTTSTGPSPERN